MVDKNWIDMNNFGNYLKIVPKIFIKPVEIISKKIFNLIKIQLTPKYVQHVIQPSPFVIIIHHIASLNAHDDEKKTTCNWIDNKKLFLYMCMCVLHQPV